MNKLYTKLYYTIFTTILLRLYNPVAALTWHERAPGLLYAHDQHNNQSIHILKADMCKLALVLAAGKQVMQKAQKVTEFAQAEHAVAAVNAGFFDIVSRNKWHELWHIILDRVNLSRYVALPAHGMKKNGQWYGITDRQTGAIGWTDDGTQLYIGLIKTHAALVIGGDKSYSVHMLNRPYKHEDALYNHLYGRYTPSYDQHKTEIVIGQSGLIVQVLEYSNGNTLIPDNGYVYVPSADTWSHMEPVSPGMSAQIQIQASGMSDEDDDIWHACDNLLGSTPLLVHDGIIPEHIRRSTSTFYTKKHPRTAVGIHVDGSLLLVTADGRSAQAQGFTMQELAAYMRQLGAQQALNLDGGGSTTMVIDDTIINTPSGREFDIGSYERSVGNALLCVPR